MFLNSYQVVILIFNVLNGIVTLGLTTMFTRYEYIRLGSYRELINRKFVSAIIAMGYFLFFYDIFNIISFSCLADGDKANAAVQMIGLFVGTVSIFSYLYALYLRTSTIILAERFLLMVRILLGLVIVSSIATGISQLEFVLADEPKRISPSVCLYGGPITDAIGSSIGIFALILDSIYTGSFLLYVFHTKKTLPHGSHEVSDIIASQGLKIMASTILVVIFSVAYRFITHDWGILFFVPYRTCFTVATYFWFEMKWKLDKAIPEISSSKNYIDSPSNNHSSAHASMKPSPSAA